MNTFAKSLARTGPNREITEPPLLNIRRANGPNSISFFLLRKERKKGTKERKERESSKGGGGGVTIHQHLPASITSVLELRLTHRLRLHEACSILFDSIPLGRSPLIVNVQVKLVPRIGIE
ncbi:hypothetical protein PIB30_076143 [Stylosanthes scabra]|uniref:Ribosomal protein S10 n=1 Tax=Stylosanthes scabra TaxID=79078 RepID=A0ABU6USH4_9FABA|nr:hypothetical protein [Stylosanthes scabra]